jgi:tetratricopeptide (TPR) repeat protein
MAKVSLRIYNREIESMVDNGQLDEAIAHCRHILNTFPKNLETYRLLGKAYLEARRYNEATDIFERLLMAVPDDFVAHVGMSIIHDEQNDLDAAIWHMERAFEVQPSNAAIKSELQRLFGRRDGVEPPKVRLTRGALAHMYVQGELYPQAISEIKAVLEEDRDRHDMQVLLARAYFQAGQKNEAAEMCSQLLRRYPYCFDANRVLVELLPETERGESPQASRHRVNELDPYATFVTGSVFHTDEVADAAVSLERLDWDGEPVDLGQEWKDSLGIERGDKTPAAGEEPDWLKTDLTYGAFSASTSTEEPASVSSSDEDIPEFLREAGWGKDTGAYQEEPGTFETSDDSSKEPSLAEGDLPDWIKAMAPTGAGVADSSQQDVADEDLTQDDVPDWLQGLGDAQDTTTDEQTLEQGDLPDWLAAMKPEDEAPQPEMEEELVAKPIDEGDLPDWLKPVQPEDEKILAQEVPDESQPEMHLEAPQEPAQEFPEIKAESLSDWQLGDEETAGTVDFDATDTGTLGTSADEQDDAIAWLESLAAKHGAKPEELVTDPDARKETAPDWVQQAKAVKDQGAAEAPAPQEEPLAEPSEDLPDFLAEMLGETKQESGAEVAPVDTLGPSAEEQDDAIAWLENLAAKHGAKSEELVTDPDARKDTAPDWVQKAAEEAAHPEEPIESELEWMEPDKEEEEGEGSLSPELEDTQPQKPVSRASADETGVWLRDLGEEGGFAGEDEPATELESPAMGTDEDVPDWLRGVEAEPYKAEAGPTTGEEAQEVPDWLSELEGEPSKAEAGPPSEEEAQEPQEVPDWLLGVETEPTEGESFPAVSAEEEASEPEASPTPEAEAQEIPDWLGGVEAEPSEAESLPAFPSEEETVFEPSQEGEFQPVEAASESDEPDFTDWLKSVETEETSSEVEETIGEKTPSEDLPSWLAGLEEKEVQPEAPVAGAEDDLPEWLRSVDEQEPVQTEPTAPTDWQSADVEISAREEPVEPEPEPAQVMEEPPAQAAPPEYAEPISEPEPELTAPEREPYQEPVVQIHSDMPSSDQESALTQAQFEMTRGNVPGSLDSYDKLIRNGRMLDEIIFDLREALYRYPVDVSILQALGDAYMRANRLQDALDAYTKAEELLR